MPTQTVVEFLQRAFWQLLGVFTALFVTGVSALVGVLWYLNGNVVALNERLGNAIDRLTRAEERAVRQDERDTKQEALLLDHSLRLQATESALRRLPPYEKAP